MRRHLDATVATLESGLSNARVEAINNKIKLTVRMAYSFRSLDNLFAMVMLICSGLQVPLLGRA
ncbi:MAG: transposase [Coriobacteriaceae bacterium]|nr:MAG: transposase [Coriobacteriaceae bacterium]